MKAFVTGALGFVGKHLVDRLLTDGWEVVIYDRKDPPPFICPYLQGDVLDLDRLTTCLEMARPDVVFHLAALADVRSALKMPRQQLDQNLVATFNVLEAMKAADVKRIAFTSTAVVYGDIDREMKAYNPFSLTERGYAFPQQTSIYGAMKLASESLISAYCEGYGMSADIYRLVSVVGPGYRHGNLFDFYTRLNADPTKLELFGNPAQQKYYIAVKDVIDALVLTVNRPHAGAEIWNVSHDRSNTIQDSIDAVCDVLGVKPETVNPGASWPGDLPQLVLDCSKLRSLGWTPKVAISDAMRATVRDLVSR